MRERNEDGTHGGKRADPVYEGNCRLKRNGNSSSDGERIEEKDRTLLDRNKV